MRTDYFIAKRYLFAKKSNNAITWISWISVLGVTIGTTALFLILSVFNGFEDLNLIYYKKLSPDLKITATTGANFLRNKISNNQLKNEDINYHVSVLEKNVLLKYDNSQYFAKLVGVSDEFMKSKELDSVISAGKFILKDKAHYNYAVIGRGIEYALGMDVTQPLGQISVLAAKKNAALNNLNPASSLKQMEIFPSGMFSIQQEMDDQVMFVPIEFAEELLDEKGMVSAIDIYVKSEKEMMSVQEDLKKIIPSNFRIKNRYQLNESLYKVLNTERWAVYFVLTFILIVAICNIIGSVTMLIIDKMKDIAILRTLGATYKQIQNIYFLEGMMISLIGTFLGLFIGASLAFIQMKYSLIGINSSDGLFLQAYPVKVVAMDFLLVFSTVFLISFIATWFTSKQSRIVNLSIREIIVNN